MKFTLDDYIQALRHAALTRETAVKTQEPALFALARIQDQRADLLQRILLVSPPEGVSVEALPWRAIWYSTEYATWFPAAGAPIELVRWEAQALANILGQSVVFDDPAMQVDPE